MAFKYHPKNRRQNYWYPFQISCSCVERWIDNMMFSLSINFQYSFDKQTETQWFIFS